MGFFGPTKIPAAVTTELEARTTTKVGLWNASKKPWAHLMSLASGCQGSALQFGVGFGAHPQTGYMNNYERPDPIIVSIDVRKLGELGTTKKTTVTLKAFTFDQLNTIAKCYCIPGMSLRVQYGWSVGVDGSKSVAPNTAVATDIAFFDYVASTQEKYPNYDGAQGRLVTYNITSDADNTWTISLEITGIAAMVSNAKINNYSNDCACSSEGEAKENPVDGADGKKNKKLPNLSAILLNVVNETSTATDSINYIRNSYGYAAGEIYGYTAKITARSPEGAPAEETFFGGLGNAVNAAATMVVGVFGGGESTPIPTNQALRPREEYYISYKSLQILINELALKNGPGDKPVITLNSDKITIKVPENPTYGIFCADPRIAIIPYSPYAEYQPELTTGSPNNPYPNNQLLRINDILFNIKYIRGVLDSDSNNGDTTDANNGLDVLSFLKQIFGDFNNNCGGLWDFAFVDSSNMLAVNDPLKINTGTVIATVDLKSISTLEPYTFSATPKKSNVRSMKMDLKLTEAMKTQATYGGGFAKPVSNGGCGSTVTAFTKLSGINLGEGNVAAKYAQAIANVVEYVHQEAKKPENSGKAKVTININDKLKENNIPNSDYTAVADAINAKLKAGNCGPESSECKKDNSETLLDRLKAFKDHITDETVSAVRGDVIREASLASGADSDYCRSSIIPAEFGLTIDGIGGLKFGQSIDCDRFPDEYRKYFYYQVLTSEHSVTPEDWVTTVAAIFRMK